MVYDMTRHAINWFEIPVTDFERAKHFYEAIFSTELAVHELQGQKMAFFPSKPQEQGVGGTLIECPDMEPGTKGPLIYLNAGHDLSDVSSKVENAGGKLLLDKTLITEQIGYYALFIDSEGNKLALHSPN